MKFKYIDGIRRAYLNCRLDTLELDGLGLPHTVLLHINQLARVTIQTPGGVALDVLGAQLGQHANRAGAGVLCQCARNDLHSVRDSLVGPLLDTLDRAGNLTELDRDSHLDGTTTGSKAGVEDHVAGNGHGVLQVTLDLVQDILGGTAQQDSAGLGSRALAHECEILVTNLLNLKETAAGTNVGFLDVVDTVNDSGTSGTGDTVVVGLTDAAESSDVVLDQEVLCEI